MKKVLGLMTCFNRKYKTKNSIETLIKGNPNLEISFLVVDDNSTDGTKEEIEKIPKVEVISGNGSLFYSGGMRNAIENAKQKQDRFCYTLRDDYICLPPVPHCQNLQGNELHSQKIYPHLLQ